MNCDCIKRVNAQLKPHDTELVLTFRLTESLGINSTLAIPTKWIAGIKKRKKPMTIVITFCPFCGKKADKES